MLNFLSIFLDLSHFHEYLIAIVILEMNSQMNSLNKNLINVCDIQTYIQTLWLLEALDLLDRETKNTSTDFCSIPSLK